MWTLGRRGGGGSSILLIFFVLLSCIELSFPFPSAFLSSSTLPGAHLAIHSRLLHVSTIRSWSKTFPVSGSRPHRSGSRALQCSGLLEDPNSEDPVYTVFQSREIRGGVISTRPSLQCTL